MEIRTYQNKIVLVDDEQFAIAEVDFPAVDGRDGVVEISHTFVDESMRGRVSQASSWRRRSSISVVKI